MQPKIRIHMKKHLYIAIFFCLFALCAHAETLVLRTGARVKGTIVFQNEEVVIIRDESGARFQYPRTDVQDILANESIEIAKDSLAVNNGDITTSKKASILLELAGGAAIQPKEAAGGGFSVDLLVGSHHIKDRHVFVGAGLGYHGLFLGAQKYNFLPIQMAVRMPFTEAKHAPVFGAAIGYGVALSKNYVGGIYAGLDFGYRCQLNPKSALAVTAYAQFQQATLTIDEIMGGVPFTNIVGRDLVTTGVKLSLYF